MKLLKGFGSDNSSQPDPDKTKTETELDTTLVETQTTNSKFDTTLANTSTATANRDRTKTEGAVTTKERGNKSDRSFKWYSYIPVNARRWLLFIAVLATLLQLAQCTFRQPPVISDPQSSPQLSTSSANSAATTSACTTDLQSRLKQANISSKRIDRLFAEKHSDLRDRKLAAQDEALKKEWCQLAEQEISSRQK